MRSWPADMPTEGHWTYHLCAGIPGVPAEDEIAHVYVGVTSRLRQRLSEHSRRWWFQTIDPDLCEFIEHPTRAAAEASERVLIAAYEPVVNRRGLRDLSVVR